MLAMNSTDDAGLRVELHEAAGSVKVFFPGEVVSELTAERDRLRKELGQLRAEMETLRTAKQTAESQRDQYLRSLRAVMEQDLGLTEESWLDVMKNGIPSATFFEELAKSFEKDAGGENG
jgi:hypothetical protein